eukprot:CAMPEP_0169367388 /NCGR_PEP_ID=MMETSP1017-20121227/33636_1 /TAXON_ID=342587 /ORGANISM="Karlodinium micrum, Strain CCMP2283" /LENGTH=519 /DNA_ID=CAMNT_0009465413 /DNA_START=18 /DNA_END=1574 /DNA_ORIENTATION=+
MEATVEEALAALESPRATALPQIDSLEDSSRLTRAIEALTAEIHSACLVEQDSRTSLVRAIETLSARISQCSSTTWDVAGTSNCHLQEVRVDEASLSRKYAREAANECKQELAAPKAIWTAYERTSSAEAAPGWVEVGKSPSPMPQGLPDLDRNVSDSTATASVPTEGLLARHADFAGMEPRYEPHNFTTARNDEITQWLPKVEVSVKMYRVNEVDTASMTFQADFVIHLDWEDVNLKDFQGDLRLLDWDKKFFNPKVSIYNAKDVNEGWLDGADTIPRWYPSRKPPPGVERHLRKTMRFRGLLYMSRADMRCFPFDIQFLPIHIKAAPCRNLENVLSNRDGSKVPKDAFKFYLDDSTLMCADKDYIEAEHKGCGNFVQKGINGQPGIDAYRVSIFVERPFLGSYAWNLVIMNVLAWLAGTSFWDGASPDVSSRMSITLTVILTIAVSSRPVAIEKTTYVTMNDQCQQMCLAIATIVSFLNVINVQICGGHHPESPMYMQEFYLESKSFCEKSWCGSTW